MSLAPDTVFTPPGSGTSEVAHIVDRTASTRAYISGEEIEALCGERFVPSRDPEQYPVCSPCQVEYERIINARGQ